MDASSSKEIAMSAAAAADVDISHDGTSRDGVHW